MGIVRTDSSEGLHDRSKHWFKTAGHGRRSGGVSGGEEVGQAGNDADGGLGSNLPQALGENREMATRNDLGSLEEWTGTKGSLPHIPGHVGVTDQAVAPRLGHSEHSTTEEAAIIYFDFSYTLFFV